MGAFQSKLWSEANSELPESPSESQPLSNNGKPIAPFRDPRSISDDVERTPIQIAASKAKINVKNNEDEKENRPAVDQTPTGPSLAQKFKVRFVVGWGNIIILHPSTKFYSYHGKYISIWNTLICY